MTDRINSFIVVLESDIRDDDAQPTIDAIRQIRGVLSVEPNVSDAMAFIAESRARRELGTKIWKVLYPE